jgi:hypothetical protein
MIDTWQLSAASTSSRYVPASPDDDIKKLVDWILKMG